MLQFKKMKQIKITDEEFKNKLGMDPRVNEEYIERIELPQAFSSGNKFLKNFILEKADYDPETNTSSDWFQFSQMIDEVKVDEKEMEIIYDEDEETHPPIMPERF